MKSMDGGYARITVVSHSLLRLSTLTFQSPQTCRFVLRRCAKSENPEPYGTKPAAAPHPKPKWGLPKIRDPFGVLIMRRIDLKP